MFRDRVLQHYREKGYTLRERVRVRGASGTVHACDLVAQGPLGNLVVQFEDYGGFEGPELDAVRRIARDVGATPVVAAEHVSQSVRRHAAQSGVVVMDAAALEAPQRRVVEVQATGREEPAYPPWPGQKKPEADGPTPWPDADRPAQEWPDGARARPHVTTRMDPGEVDDLVQEWSRPEPARPTRREDPGFWKYRDETAEATEAPVEGGQEAEAPTASGGFSWLQQESRPAAPAPPVAAAPEPTPEPVRPEPAGAEAATPQLQQAAAPDLRWLVGFAVAGASAGAAFLGLGVLFGVL